MTPIKKNAIPKLSRRRAGPKRFSRKALIAAATIQKLPAAKRGSGAVKNQKASAAQGTIKKSLSAAASLAGMPRLRWTNARQSAKNINL